MTKISGICLALDNLSPSDALSTAIEMKEVVVSYKLQQLIDSSAFNQEAAEAVQEIQAIGLPVVYDMKIIDIRTAMQRRSSVYAHTGGILTAHGRIDVDHIAGAVEGVRGSSTKIYVVTALTSENPAETFIETGMDTRAVILERARKAVLAGAHGIVCATADLEFIDSFSELSGLDRLTPAIREEDAETHDQIRVGTPYHAGFHGSTLGVVGRPILNALDRIETATRIAQDFERGVADRKAKLAKG